MIYNKKVPIIKIQQKRRKNHPKSISINSVDVLIYHTLQTWISLDETPPQTYRTCQIMNFYFF